ncbi:DUF4231 domain-containing protein [Acidovorax sp.]|uniref:DUF4231 domain-containing protein n=1 Tax=Acidovorax sp. TaxID=1872122 RepID=UPI0019A75D02|nr:DUF4231 domain-containing protein [Acidovorax sp.]MBC8263114.1 DUF4231 domain-containing protein [Anaerolineales bacterium]MBL7091105.1 DUF4231 domain-containing protein [Acidovorax sp.]
MTEELAYLDDRLEGQRKWHSSKATWNKNRFYVVEIITLVAGGLIPVINVLDAFPEPWLRVLSASLASVIVIVTGIGKLYKFQENWLNFRAVVEMLKREREFYLYEVGEYAVRSDRKRSRILVERVESILGSTTSQYVSIHGAEREEPQVSPASVAGQEQPTE